jgi:hypothetical protein
LATTADVGFMDFGFVQERTSRKKGRRKRRKVRKRNFRNSFGLPLRGETSEQRFKRKMRKFQKKKREEIFREKIKEFNKARAEERVALLKSRARKVRGLFRRVEIGRRSVYAPRRRDVIRKKFRKIRKFITGEKTVFPEIED